MALVLLPNLLFDEQDISVLPAVLPSYVEKLSGLIVESEKQGRRYLRKFISHEKMQEVSLALLNEHTSPKECEALLEPISRGEMWGLISDLGLPCIADPGSFLVRLAHKKNIRVDALSGPSSIILALQLSGFSGQNFSFHGYLPKEEDLLNQKLKTLEKQSKLATQIWIEAPYRTQKMFEILKGSLHDETELCIAANIQMENQILFMLKIKEWKQKQISFQKDPAIFLIEHRGSIEDAIPVPPAISNFS